MHPPKPTKLDIREENRRLIGVDQNGTEWRIGWCGNGQYSHWVLHLKSNPEIGWYVFAYSYGDREKELIEQIKEAEHKYRIYS